MTPLAFELWRKRRMVEAPDDGEATGGCLTHVVLLEDCGLRDEVGIADLMTKHQHLSSHRLLALQVEEETDLLSHEPPLSSSCQETCPVASSSLLLVSAHLPFFVAQPSSCPPQSFSASPPLCGSPPLFF